MDVEMRGVGESRGVRPPVSTPVVRPEFIRENFGPSGDRQDSGCRDPLNRGSLRMSVFTVLPSVVDRLGSGGTSFPEVHVRTYVPDTVTSLAPSPQG